MDNQNEDWITWEGGENPVPGAIVDVKFRNGVVHRKNPSVDWEWHHSEPGAVGWEYEIGAYRVVGAVSDDPQAEIARLQERVRELEEDRAWRPIETATPNEGKSILVQTADEPPIVGEAWWRREDDGELELWWSNTGPGDYFAEPINQISAPVTHWMPLPAPTPPSTTEEGEG